MRYIRIFLLALIVLWTPSASLVGADCQSYIYLHNWTEDDLHVYIDGQDWGVAAKGYPAWYYVDAGHHRVETYRVNNPWARSKFCTWVGCFPKGEVTVSERDF